MENGNMNRNHIMEGIMQNEFDHNIILYSDISTILYVYLNYSKRALESLNEIVLILPHYHTITDVLNNLTDNGIDIAKCKKEGSIVVVEAKKAYYSLKNEFVGVMIMTKMLLRRAKKLDKTGVTVISDMGLFFHENRIENLIK
jgi:hypothetical protein